MQNKLLALAREEIVAMSPYRSARSTTDSQKIKEKILLDANENPWSDNLYHRYPEPIPHTLVAMFAVLYKVNTDQILITRGVDEGIDLLIRLFCRDGLDQVMICPPTYGMYKVAATIQGAGVIEVPLIKEEGFALNLSKILELWQPSIKLIFLCSPNNPTGNLLESQDILLLCQKLANQSIVIVDEAYIEFAAKESLVKYLNDFPNLIILRTLSKAYGLAGIRCGVIIANAAIIALLKKIIAPYPIPKPIADIAVKHLSSPIVQHQIDAISQEKNILFEFLSKLTFVKKVWMSDANFLLFEVENARMVLDCCLQAGIILRDRSNEFDLNNCIRVTIGTHRENKMLMEALHAIEPEIKDILRYQSIEGGLTSSSISKKIIFLDRDGTLIDEPPDKQVDHIAKFKLKKNLIPALLMLRDANYHFVMVSNQDGLGTNSFAQSDFEGPQHLLLDILKSQDIAFDGILICPHRQSDHCGCRKPAVGLVIDYLREGRMDFANSYVIGDRTTDVKLAENMGIKAILYDDTKDWLTIAKEIITKPRRAQLKRLTNETKIDITIHLDDCQTIEINTGLGFFDHMLHQLAKHGGFGLILNVKGDLVVDEHHTVEDTAIVLGEALRSLLNDKRGIARYGFLLPMDEALATVAIDLCGRPYFVFEGKFAREKVGELPTELISHFFRSLSQSLGAALHIKVQGENAHHMIESIFKGVGRVLRQAMNKEGNELPTTKGIL